MLAFPALAQVVPAWIHRFDQRDLLLASESFQLLLTSDRRLDVVIAFVINQTMASVLLREAFEGAGFVLANARLQVAGYSDVEHAGKARHDVHGVEVLAHFGATL